MAIPLLVTYQAPPANVVDLVFDWTRLNIHFGVPHMNLNVFPPQLSGRIDPMQFRNDLHGLNMYLQTNMATLRRRWFVPFVLFPAAIVFILMGSAWQQGVGLLWAGISMLLSFVAVAVIISRQHRARFNVVVAGLRAQVAKLDNVYRHIGLRWSVQVEERLVALRRNRASLLPFLHLHIEVLGQPQWATGMQVPVAMPVPAAGYQTYQYSTVATPSPYFPAPGTNPYSTQQPQPTTTEDPMMPGYNTYQQGGSEYNKL